MHRLNTKTRLTMLCLSGFELYSRWVPLFNAMWRQETDINAFEFLLILWV